jgi:cation diffusion facilitator CzcD-associated flavoprotein CzcO
MRERLARKPEIYEALRPNYPVVCKRISPGPRYLEALCEDNVEFISSGVSKVIETGLIDDDGKFTEVDVIVCATGFDE